MDNVSNSNFVDKKIDPQDPLFMNQNEDEEWINEEKETIGELKRGALAAQYPQDFSVDSDFLNQPNNVWLPARLHPEISPGEFQDWLEKHDNQNIKVDQNVRRRKSLLRYSSKDFELQSDSFDSSTTDPSFRSLPSQELSDSHTSTSYHETSNFDEFPDPQLFNKIDRSKPSLKRSKLVNKRRDSSALSRRGRKSESSSTRSNITDSSTPRKKDQDGNWKFSLAELSLEEDSKNTPTRLTRKLSTAKILDRISKDVSELSFEDLGFDGVQNNFSPDSSFVDSVTKIDHSHYSSSSSFTDFLTIDLNSPLIKGDSVNSEPSKLPKSAEPLKSSKSLNAALSSSKKSKSPEPEVTKKTILPSAMSFLRFGKSKSSSVGSDKSQKKESVKNLFESQNKKSQDVVISKSKDGSSSQMIGYADMPSHIAENLMMPDQASRYPNVLTPVRPQPTVLKYTQPRFPIHIERAIYRLASIKLTNPKRPLYQKVLLTNMMYWYLELINPKSFQTYHNTYSKSSNPQKPYNQTTSATKNSNNSIQEPNNSLDSQKNYNSGPQIENNQIKAGHNNQQKFFNSQNNYYGSSNSSNNQNRKQPFPDSKPFENQNHRSKSPSNHHRTASDVENRTNKSPKSGTLVVNNGSRESLIRKRSKKSNNKGTTPVSQNQNQIDLKNRNHVYSEKKERDQPITGNSSPSYLNGSSVNNLGRNVPPSQDLAHQYYFNKMQNHSKPSINEANFIGSNNRTPLYQPNGQIYNQKVGSSLYGSNSQSIQQEHEKSFSQSYVNFPNKGSVVKSTQLDSSSPLHLNYYQQPDFRRHAGSTSPSLPSQSAELSVVNLKYSK
ncbi:Protein zds1 [Smittium mucronatum]|uniref:Protein zds1 n=1 Tax=Smittium mucronatum TaxID=133383 RepID=A0A1R0GSA3_9FUNG|nr:Protein zds1 [Smittium mucronatum]